MSLLIIVTISMKKLLTDIELDFYELKCLLEYLDKNPEDSNLFKVAERSLNNLSERMGELKKEFAHYKAVESLQKETPVVIDRVDEKPFVKKKEDLTTSESINCEEIQKDSDVVKQEEILQGKVMTPESGSMYRALSLNDVFRYSRELFDGDSNKLKEVVAEMENLWSYEQAVGYLSTVVSCSIEDYAFQDMDDFLQRYYKI